MRVLIIQRGADARAERLLAAARATGAEAAIAAAGRGLRARPDVVITTGSAAAHLTGQALRARGIPWILDAGDGWHPADAVGRRLEIRLVRAADAVACATPEALADLHQRIGAASFLLDEATLARQFGAVTQRRRPSDALRILMIGPVNSPHVEHLALAMHERGLQVHVGGDVWDGLPPSVLPAAGVPVDTVTAPLVLWLRRVIGELRPHVVHAHWTPFAFKTLLAGARPLVVTPWGSDVYRVSGVFHWANHVVARRANLVVTDSQDLISRMVEMGTPPERTELLNWGVDLEQFTPSAEPREAIRRRLGLGPGPMILSPRSLKPLYNPQTILAAFAEVGARRPDVQLVLKHMAEDSPDLGELPHPDRVRVVSHVPYEQMADYYRAADACVSIADTDSSPRSVWEAMACECPCVVSDLPWVHETMQPGRDALVVPIEAGAVASALDTLLTDRATADAMRRNGRSLVERTRDQRVEMDRLVGIYERLAGR